MGNKGSSVYAQAIKIGLIGGGVAVLLALIGMVEAFSQRDIVGEIISISPLPPDECRS